MVELRNVFTAWVWSGVSAAVGDVVRQSNWFGYCSSVSGEVADCDLGDFRLVDVPDSGRSNQYAVVGRPADRVVFLRHWIVRVIASF